MGPQTFISFPRRSHDGLNPAHVPYWWVNNPTLGEFCFTMIGRADIEGSKSNVAMNAWLPQASYPCGNFSDTSSFKFRRSKGSLGHAFTVRIRTENQNQTSFYPSECHALRKCLLFLSHLWCGWDPTYIEPSDKNSHVQLCIQALYEAFWVLSNVMLWECAYSFFLIFGVVEIPPILNQVIRIPMYNYASKHYV